MDSSKLIVLLGTFSSSELREFKDFVASPYYNKNKELILFYNYLKNIAPHFPLKKIERRYAYQQIFSGKPYDEKHLNYLMSFLLKQAEKFIGQKKYEMSERLQEYHIMSSFIDRGLDKHYSYTQNKTNKSLEASPYRNANYYYQKYLIAETASQQFFKKKQRRFDQSLQFSADYFDLYYLANKLIYSCEMINRGNIIHGSYDLKFLGEIKSYLTRKPHEEIPAVHIYYQILMMQVSKDSDLYFEKLKSLINEYEKFFPIEEQRQIFSYALNHSIRQLNMGRQKYLQESFNLYRQGIESKLLFEGNYLSPWAYKNTIKAGLMLSEFDWVESFIKKYNELQPPKFRQNGLHYNLADLYYSKKEFDKAHFHLTKVEYSDIYINIDSKKLLMKIYYESEETEVLISALAAFKIFLKRNKIISDNMRNSYGNFIQVLGLLVKDDKKSRKTAQQLLENLDAVVERNWLKHIANC